MNDTMDKPCMTNEQVAFLVKLYRSEEGLVWSQETLAELSGLTVRTIQRVEAAEPSSNDTRRAIARAMDIEDLDVFNKPWPFTDEERQREYEQEAARQREEFDKNHVLLDAQKVDGRGLVIILLDQPGFLAMCAAPMDELPAPVQDEYARIIDYFRDCLDIADVASRQDMLSYGDEMTISIKSIEEQGYLLLAATRNLAAENKGRPAKTIMPDAVIYIVVTKKEDTIKKMAVPRDLGRMTL